MMEFIEQYGLLFLGGVLGGFAVFIGGYVAGWKDGRRSIWPREPQRSRKTLVSVEEIDKMTRRRGLL